MRERKERETDRQTDRERRGGDTHTDRDREREREGESGNTHTQTERQREREKEGNARLKTVWRNGAIQRSPASIVAPLAGSRPVQFPLGKALSTHSCVRTTSGRASIGYSLHDFLFAD